MASAYATFAARGIYCQPRPVTAVLNSRDKVVEDYPEKCGRVLKTEEADAVNDILKGVQEPGGFGNGAGLALNQQSAGKTGTTSSNMAVWFVGYTPNLAAASMIAGANSKGQHITLNGQVVGGSYISGAAGSTTAGPVWGEAMKAVEQYIPDDTFTRPDPQTIRGMLIPVPSLYGQSISSASEALRQAGFNPVVGSRVDSGNAEGTVAYLSPGSGGSAPSGSTVTIYVSDGTPYVKPKPKKKPKPKPRRTAAARGGN